MTAFASNRYAVHVVIFYRNKTTDHFSCEIHADSEAAACGMARAAARHYSTRRAEIEDLTSCASLIESAE